MDDNFNKFSQEVMDHITQQGYGEKTQRAYRRCFNSLGDYFTEKEVNYSEEEANIWLLSVHMGRTTFGLYAAAVHKLNDLYLYGEIQRYHYNPSKTTEGKLCGEFKDILEKVRVHISAGSYDTVSRHSQQCASILLRLQERSIVSISGVNYEALIDEFNSSKSKSYYSRCSHHTSLRLLLQFLFDKGLVPFGFTLFVDAMTMRTGYFWNNVPGEQIARLKTLHDSNAIPLDSFLEMRDRLFQTHSDAGYSRTSLSGILRITNLFYLFMDMNGLRYCPRIGYIWLDSVKPFLDSIEHKRFRRVLCILEGQAEKAQFRLNSHFVFRETYYKRLPDWCLPQVDSFLGMKRDEGWAPSTIRMYKISICRFCISMHEMGVRSFKGLDASKVKQFNLKDRHNTPEGKNAYNSRIRKFLEYLGENHISDNPFLSLSLPCVCASRETLVITLTQAEQDSLRDIFREDDGSISLREKAMVQLGLYMGIRETDIISLAIDDIDWEHASIRILQDKTNYEICLPMPVSVANALYRYIMRERPETSARSIFIRRKAPYCQVGRGACRSALDHALPERSVPGSGFHATRKTYATNLLRNEVAAQQVAEALGHRGLGSLHKYLSLDESRMRLCGLSLDARGLLMKGGFHE